MFHLLLIAKHLKEGALTPKDLLDATIIVLIVVVPTFAYYGLGIDQMVIRYLLGETAPQYSTAVRTLTEVTPLFMGYSITLSIFNIITTKKPEA